LPAGLLENNLAAGVRRLQRMAQSSNVFYSSRELERLAGMQQRLSRKYFRLREAQRILRARASEQPKTTGALLADALDAERRRLGRELHTGVGQALAGIHVHAAILESELPDLPERARTSLQRITALADAALEQVRGVSRRLYVPAWQALSLTDALRNLWDESGISEKFSGSLALEPLSFEPPADVRRALYLGAQEGLSNVIQHADARHVQLSLRLIEGRLTLAIEDDGSGFSAPAETGESAAGIGLRSLRDLAEELGGELQTGSTPQGAYLTISFPVTYEQQQ